MSFEIIMPSLSPTMESGTLAKWLVNVGDKIAVGDLIAEIETDKATMEAESVGEGTVAQLLVSEGTEDVEVGAVIAILAENGEDIAKVGIQKQGAKPQLAEVASIKKVPLKVPVSTEPKPEAPQDIRLRVSPLARRIASQSGVDLTILSGSGPVGRIVKADVDAALFAAQSIPAQKAVPIASPVQSTEYAPHDGVPMQAEILSNMRKTIAKRLTESKTTVPHFYLTIDCEMDALLAQRKQLNSTLEGRDIKLSVNDYVIRAAGLALKSVPDANVQFAGDSLYRYDRADISVAVAIDGGLITPVIRGASNRGLADISAEMNRLATKARAGKLQPIDYSGGTFSISNLGMFGVKEFAAIINPPQAAILAVGAGQQRAVIKDGAVVPATVMSCTLSCDHRAIDGAVAAMFLAAFKGYVEDPLTMLL